MRLVATEYMSLDGVFEEPGHWSFPFFDEQAAQFKWTELEASDALLLGRRTYEGFAAAWPAMEGTGEFGVRMNSMPKHVVSSTLRTLEWTGSRLIEGDPIAGVRQLKRQPGRDLLLSGSGRLFNALIGENLIDLYRIMLHPIVVGQGRKLFDDTAERRALKLTETKRFPKGIMILEYEPAENAPAPAT